MTQTSHVMGLHVYMICLQMCQVSKVHNCLEDGKIIRVHICNGFSIPFFSLLNTEKKLKKYIASKMYFLFSLFFFLSLWNMSFITSRGSSSRVLHYQSKIHTERCCEFQEIKQSMVGRGSGWFLSGCLKSPAHLPFSRRWHKCKQWRIAWVKGSCWEISLSL